MSAKKFTILAVLAFALTVALVLNLGCSKDDPVGPVIPRPIIDIFSANPSDIVPPDSSLVSWKSRLADSVKIFPSGQKLNPKDSGQIYVKPAVPTEYTLVAYSGGGRDSSKVSIVMTALAANIDIFKMAPDTLVNGDSSVITWKTTQADSIVVNQGVGKLNPVDSGQSSIVPSNTVPYRAVAYSIYGNDTITINVRVKKPTLVRTIGGSYYKGEMGSAQLSPALTFAAADANNVLLDNLWINLRVTEGDGTLIPSDSVLTNSMGFGNVSYIFSGLLGHAIIRANFRDVDTVFAYLRANTIVPGLGGQGQYLLFSEFYADVKDYNGNPISVDHPTPDPFVYANYESTLHTVFAINDLNNNGLAENNEDILEVIMTTGYPYKTKDSLGIGSTYDDIKSIYGQPDDVFFSPEDPENPPAIGLDYQSIGFLFYIDTVIGNPVDTNKPILEIHVNDFVTRTSMPRETNKEALEPIYSTVNYRRIRR